MARRIIKIDADICSGCSLCADACHEGAIAIVEGKAKLIREDYCDGLGNCLPVCPTGAISFEERETAPALQTANDKAAKNSTTSELHQWPVQLRIVPVHAPYFDNADVLIAADCAAYACGSFHSRFMKDKITFIGCPKLDNIDYSEKLTEILEKNNIRSITSVKMEVPCCNGIEQAVIKAIEKSGKNLPRQASTFSITGEVLEG
ncbi:MAG: 4Fe-4S binding protein [Treponema sp.]|nr:4Fe-4S binding protein [Treponema sp.]